MLRKTWIYIFLGVFILLFSIEVAPFIEISSHIPDFVLIFIVFLAQKYGALPGLTAGFLLGLLLDFFSGQLLGAQAFAKMTVGLFAGLLGHWFIVYSLRMGFFIVAISACLQTLVFYMEIILFSHISSIEYFQGVWVDILYTILLAPFVLIIFNFIDVRLTKRM